MVCGRYDKLEPGTPSYEERLEIVKTVAARVKRVIIRVQPYMPEVFRDVMENIPRNQRGGRIRNRDRGDEIRQGEAGNDTHRRR